MYEIFADLLKQHGITAYRVAKDTGITTATLTDWKKGRSTPKADKLQIIAAYFGVSVDYLLGKEKEPVTDSDGFRLEDDIDLTDVDIAFLGGFIELTEENQATIRDMVRIMRERQKE